ncbi:MAG: GNAT family N-acetyltransferase [Thermoleophilia bacterium]|nr:GNAT family N-acetyltransferase [Thermoleophilia bacterium]
MPLPLIEPFADEHLDAAGALLAERHARHREAEPFLPARYEDPATARAEVEALWRADDTPGAVAIRDGRVVGFVVGARKPDEMWGANVWVDPAGLAVERAEDARDLYAAAAAKWVAAGRTAHYAVVPASDAELVDAWFRLGFGQQHAFGIRELGDGDEEWPDGVREAEPPDVDELVRLDPVLAEHQLLSPVFSRRPYDEDEDELRGELEDEIASERAGLLVAERDGRIVGSFSLHPLDVSSMHAGLARPDGASFLAWAATLPDARGSGAGLALTQASFAWARARRYPAMVTDWRVTNLLSSRFWPRRGFRTTFVRLHRLIAG